MTTLEISTILASNPIGAYTFPILGEVIAGWTCRDLLIPRDRLYDLCIRAGLDPAQIPAKIQSRSAVIRALRELEADNFCRKIVDQSDRAIYLMISETIDADTESADYRREAKFTHDKKSGTLLAEFSWDQPLVDDLMTKYRDRLDSTAVSLIISRMISQQNTIPLARGVFFSHKKDLGFCEAMSRFVASLGSKCSLTYFPLPECQQAQNVVMTSFQDQFRSEIESMTQEIEDMTNHGSPRQSTLADRMARLADYEQKTSLFLTLLVADQDDLKKEQTKVKNMLSKIEDGFNIIIKSKK